MPKFKNTVNSILEKRGLLKKVWTSSIKDNQVLSCPTAKHKELPWSVLTEYRVYQISLSDFIDRVHYLDLYIIA